MGNGIKSGLSKLFDWTVSKFTEPETPATNKLDLADAIEKHLKKDGIECTTELRGLIDAYRAEDPSIEEVQTIENGRDIVKQGLKSESFFHKNNYAINSLPSSLGKDAGVTSERDHGIPSKSSRDIAERLMGKGQENDADTSPSNRHNIMDIKKEIEKNPDAIQADIAETILRTIEAVDDISHGIRPSRDNLYTLENLEDSTIDLIVKRQYETPDYTEERYDRDHYDRKLGIDLMSLHMNTASNLVSFLDKEEAKPEEKLDTLTHG